MSELKLNVLPIDVVSTVSEFAIASNGKLPNLKFAEFENRGQILSQLSQSNNPCAGCEAILFDTDVFQDIGDVVTDQVRISTRAKCGSFGRCIRVEAENRNPCSEVELPNKPNAKKPRKNKDFGSW